MSIPRDDETPQFALPFERRVVKIAELTRGLRALLEGRYASVWVEGEVSNFKAYTSGHWYFTLKDESAQLRATMFRRENLRLRFRPEDGMSVVCHGRVSVYDARGEYQLIIDEIEPRGSGALQVAFEKLKARLSEEGLFAPARKRKLPLRPLRVGLVTSPSGAALRDLLQVIERRDKGMPVLLCPAKVQGEGAALEIASALRRLGHSGLVDVIICGRGGGSMEDLFAFNEEVVARAIAACPVPVVSAVGHEVDFTIADFVSDLRAPTPSAAAELVVPERARLRRDVSALLDRARRAVVRKVDESRHRLVASRARVGDPRRVLGQQRMTLDELVYRATTLMRERSAREHKTLAAAGRRLHQRHPATRLHQGRAELRHLGQHLGTLTQKRVVTARRTFAVLAGKLDALSPLAILSRGYAIARHPQGRVVTRARDAATGDPLDLLLAEGSLRVRVEERRDEPPPRSDE